MQLVALIIIDMVLQLFGKYVFYMYLLPRSNEALQLCALLWGQGSITGYVQEY